MLGRCDSSLGIRGAALSAIVLTALAAPPAHAGGGPENVLVVVNPRSWASLTVANHFCELRKIPPSNVVYLDWPDWPVETNVETFRQKILAPILTAVNERGLGRQIDYVVYSSDFPYAVDLRADMDQSTSFPTGSLTGLTYMSSLVMGKRKEYAGLNVNFYYRRFAGGELLNPTRGFSSRYAWATSGETVPEHGLRYLLSAMLAYTSGRGNSVDEAIRYLRHSAAADGMRPAGTIYYLRNGDVRSTTRQGAFAAAVAALGKEGVAAEIVDGVLPPRKTDVQGAMIGSAGFRWPDSGSTIRPGAICEHLTSFGGIMQDGAGQTPLSELLRYGAAGASGTVVEPYAIQEKFPHPMIHVHYARGCSLAEAFYQSVYGPYQLLVVGDPLCRPWAAIPSVNIQGIEPEATVTGKISLTPAGEVPGGGKIASFRWFIDGQLVAEQETADPWELDTARLGDGYHELRLVGIESSPIQSQGRSIVPIVVNNRGRKLTARCLPEHRATDDEPLLIGASAPGAEQILVYHQRRIVAQIPGDRGQAEINPRILGQGPVTLLTIGVSGSDPRDSVFGSPLTVTIEPGLWQPAQAVAVSSILADGLQLERADGTRAVVTGTRNDNWLTTAGVKLQQPFQINGYVQIGDRGVHTLLAQFAGELEVLVDGLPIFSGRTSEFQTCYAPVPLETGWHRLRIRGELTGDDRLRLRFGAAGADQLGGKLFKYRP